LLFDPKDELPSVRKSYILAPPDLGITSSK
jgi:hypothetical protein